MGKIEIHGLVASPPTRAAMMICEITKIPYELKRCSPFERTEEFKKFNPQMQIPVLVDDGFVLQESRAIIKYLMDKYAKDDSLYPKDVRSRAVINARLDFDCGTLVPKILAVYVPTYYFGKITEEARHALKDALSILEDYLARDKWVAGSKISIADISMYSMVAAILEIKLVDLSPYPKINHWLEECKRTFPIMGKLVEEGIVQFREIIANFKRKD